MSATPEGTALITVAELAGPPGPPGPPTPPTLLDVRWRLGGPPGIDLYQAGHIPGAVSIALRDQFATWLGWLVPAGVPLGFVLAPGQDPAEVAWQALKIGYEHLAGQLDGGMAAWQKKK